VKDDKNPGHTTGGVSYLAGVVKQLREETGGKCILLDGGDWGQGSYESKLTQGKTLIDVMNSLGYDAAEIGNHEFDWGRKALDERIERARFPILAANIKEQGDLLKGVKPYTVKEVDGLKVGIIGVITTDTPGTTDTRNLKGLKFESPKSAVEKYLPELESQGVDLVVLLSHQGDVEDKKTARTVPALDVIVGGHSHTVIEKPEKSGNAIVVQSGTGGDYVGALKLQVDPQRRKIVSFTNSLIPVTDETAKPDPEIERIIAPIVSEANERTSAFVGESRVNLTHDRRKVLETVLGNVLTDAMREATGCEIALQNAGGIRDQIAKGTITYGDLYRVLPFDKYVVSMTLTGSQIKSLLESSARRSKGNLHVSGLTMDIDPKGQPGRKVSNIKVNGEPLQMRTVYTVATDDFLAGGANGFTTFREGKNREFGGLVVDALRAYIEKHSPLTKEMASIEGRLHYLSPPRQRG
jgi:2',3'-cyclic-nucleotide 2'-phosphodiesterase (5'-nucleotidase family)